MARAAKTIGLLGAAALKHAKRATVLATFEQSFYLDVGGTLIAIVAENLHDGPLNLRTAGTIDEIVDVAPRQQWVITPNTLKSDHGLIIDLVGVSLWRPLCPGSYVDVSALAAGLNSLQFQMRERDIPQDGLVKFMFVESQPESVVERAAAPAIRALETTLRDAFDNSTSIPLASTTGIDEIAGLIGLGPGLTPSGDDLLGGMMIACHHLKETMAVERLGAVVRFATDHTNLISQAHLDAAALGYAAAPLHDLLGAILRNDGFDIAAALDATAKIGHSSGFDALAGIVLTLRTYIDATSS
ncbi:MAG: DUF2877 domain-containing protein [Pseudomonadota bacterium]